MVACLNIFFALSDRHDLDKVDGTPTQQSFHGDFIQALCLTSKAKDGAIVVDRESHVTATGQIVSHGKCDPSDVQAAYVHFHEFGEPSEENGLSYLLLMTMRSGTQFACPIQSGQTVVSVLAADTSNSIALKELDVNNGSSESASECLWFTETTKAGFWRLFVLEPVTSRKLYMAADSTGVMFLTEDETLAIPREGMENPETNFRLFVKQHIDESH